jgi:hypothetical protein
MSTLLEQAIDAARGLSPEGQDRIGRMVLDLIANTGEPEEIDPAHLHEVLEGLEQASRREFVPDAEAEVIFRRLAE